LKAKASFCGVPLSSCRWHPQFCYGDIHFAEELISSAGNKRAPEAEEFKPNPDLL